MGMVRPSARSTPLFWLAHPKGGKEIISSWHLSEFAGTFEYGACFLSWIVYVKSFEGEMEAALNKGGELTFIPLKASMQLMTPVDKRARRYN